MVITAFVFCSMHISLTIHWEAEPLKLIMPLALAGLCYIIFLGHNTKKDCKTEKLISGFKFPGFHLYAQQRKSDNVLFYCHFLYSVIKTKTEKWHVS